MRTKTDQDLIRLAKKMNKLADQMKDIYYACQASTNPNARIAAEDWDGNSFDLWCNFVGIAQGAIDGESNTKAPELEADEESDGYEEYVQEQETVNGDLTAYAG